MPRAADHGAAPALAVFVGAASALISVFTSDGTRKTARSIR
jgi:hypothetical protein